MRQIQTLAATTAAIDWDVYLADEFDVPRIDIVFDSAPTTAGLITVTKDSGAGAAYDIGVQTVNPVGLTEVSITGLHGFADGDKINVSYANADSRSITATATVELPILSSVHVDGMSLSDGAIRSNTSKYRRYYHVPISAVNPGASGATWVNASATRLSGWQLDAVTEFASISTDMHDDWDTSQDPEIEVTLTVNTDNTAGTAEDVVNLRVTCFYAQEGESVPKTQVVDQAVKIGACDQYMIFHTHVNLDRNATDNPILPHDVIDCRLVCLDTGDVTDITLNDAAFYYPTTHVGIEEDDV